MLGGRRCRILPPICVPTRSPGRVDRLDFRAPGATRVSLSGSSAQAGPSGNFKGALSVESSDPDALVMWLQGRSELTYRSQKPMRLQRRRQCRADRVAIDAIKCRDRRRRGRRADRAVARCRQAAPRSMRTLKAERLDLDSASAFARALLGPQARMAGADATVAAISATPFRPVRTCIRSRRSSVTARRRSRSTV